MCKSLQQELEPQSDDDSQPTVYQQEASAALKSSADKIRKYKELLDDGILTEDEFNTKKKQLLGL